MVGEWRRLIDDYNSNKGGEPRVMFIEAWTNVDDTMQYYGDAEGNPRAHFPFNFGLINELKGNSTAHDFKKSIDGWMTRMPLGATPNWVVSVH